MTRTSLILLQPDRADVQVLQHPVDWDNLAWSTLERLGAEGMSPGTDRAIALRFREVMRNARRLGNRFVNRFVNPQFTVTAAFPSPEFIRAARRARLAWLRTLRQSLGTARRVKTAMRERLPEIRQLEFTGVLVVEGKHIHPQQWPSGQTITAGPDLKGQTFGRLMAVKRLPGGRWFCRCRCGGETVVRVKHLLYGKVRSCGCLKAEFEAQQRERKRQRGWVWTGVIT